MDLEHAKVIVEYGAADGVMTRRILSKMRPDARLIAIEFNKKLYDELVAAVSDPRMAAVHGDVREIDKILAARGVGQADVIISGGHTVDMTASGAALSLVLWREAPGTLFWVTAGLMAAACATPQPVIEQTTRGPIAQEIQIARSFAANGRS